LAKILAPIMVRIMDREQVYKHLYSLLDETVKIINSSKKNSYDGLFVVVITPETLDATLRNDEGSGREYEELKAKMYRLAGINTEEINSQDEPLPISIDPRSFDYLEKLYHRYSSFVKTDFYVNHGRKDKNPDWHDGAILYILNPKTQELRLVAVSAFLYPKPNLFELRSNGKVHGGRYQVAKKISKHEGVIVTCIIETNGGSEYTLHIFANGKEITDYVRELYQQR
jgi:hypothetical protein